MNLAKPGVVEWSKAGKPMAIDYQYQHNSHEIDYRMRLFMRAHPALPSLVPTDEQIEWERNWANYQDQLYHGWIKR